MKKVNTMKLAVPVEKTIEKLENAWSLRYCNQVFSGFCNNVCKGRFAGRCESCPIYQAYETAKQQIKDGIRSKPNVLTDLTTGVKYIVVEGQRVLPLPIGSNDN